MTKNMLNVYHGALWTVPTPNSATMFTVSTANTVQRAWLPRGLCSNCSASELSPLKAYIAKLQKPSSETGNIKKPTQPPKDGEKQPRMEKNRLIL